MTGARRARRAWAATGALLLLASGSAIGRAPFLPFFASAAWLAWGLYVWLAGAIDATRRTTPRRDRVTALAGPPLTALLLWFLSVPVGALSTRAWAHLELWRNEGEYLEILGQLERGGAPPDVRKIRVEPGATLRVAFPWGAGLLDNWRGIVFDPTGLVLRVNESADPAEARRARNLFGGHIVRAMHLRGDFYLCQFT